MKLAVKYKQNGLKHKPQTIIIELPKDIRKDEDAFYDYCEEYITDEILGEEPKWIRLEGVVHLQPIKTLN